MNWYYAENGAQKGPVSDSELEALVARKVLNGDSVVWHDGLPSWQPLKAARPDLLQTEGSATLGGVALSEQGKDLLIQQMREGVVLGTKGPGTLRYVGFWWRFLGYFIDAIILWVLAQVIALLKSMVIPFNPEFTAVDPADITARFQTVDWLAESITLVFQALYYIWFTSRLGGTPGKLMLGFRVVTTDGILLSKARAFGRWAASSLLNNFIMFAVAAIPVGLILLIGMGGLQSLRNLEHSPMVAIWTLAMAVGAMVGMLLGAFPWWMAAFDSEKRTLHDRICGTRVVWK